MTAVEHAEVLQAPVRRSVAARRTTLALARAEGRQLLRHPVTLFGLASLALVFGLGAKEASEASVGHGIGYSTWGAALLAWFMVLAANLVALRPARGGAEELYSTMQTSPRARTAASLLGVWWVVAVVALLALALDVVLLVVAPEQSIIGGVHGLQGVLVVGKSLVAIALMGSVGIAVARWIPHPVAGPVAFFASIQASEHRLHPMWGSVTDPAGTLALHLGYVAALTVSVAMIALVRHRRARSIVLH